MEEGIVIRKIAVFIVSHGRADNIKTLKTLNHAGYSGEWYIVIDDEDEQSEKYKEIFHDKVISFSKSDYKGKFDIADNGGNEQCVVYARNAVWDIAKSLGYRYFVVLDDDYVDFAIRYVKCEKLKALSIQKIDEVFEAFFDFLDASKAKAVCFAQAGDTIGGADSSTFKKELLRKAMNVWFLDAENRFEFVGRINEDTNTYVSEGIRGGLFFSVVNCQVIQVETQKAKGGLSDIYLDIGTYYKSFYTVMMCPSCVKTGAMQTRFVRWHHNINWNNCCPKILNQKHKKKVM